MLNIKLPSVKLYFKSGNSDKEYHLSIIKDQDSYSVQYSFGRRGSSLQTRLKNSSPLTLSEAEDLYHKTRLKQMREGYTEVGTGELFSGTDKAGLTTDRIPQLLNAIDDYRLEELLVDDQYLMEEKFDGIRFLARVDLEKQEVEGTNRKGIIIPVMEEVTDSLLMLERSCILDGELVGNIYHIFDILESENFDMKNKSAEYRVNWILNELNPYHKEIPCIKFPEVAYSKEEKYKLFNKIKDSKGEGVVFKKRNSIYSSGRPHSGGDQLKYKFWESATLKVLAVSPVKRSIKVITMEDVFVGNVTLPANYSFPNAGDYCEVVYLYFYEGGSLYQPIYKGVRTDKSEADSINSLKTKRSLEDE
jgi:bifunctional non-homologous end joining protein LigD